MAIGRILIVEDETLVQLDLSLQLTQLGYDVVGAARSGEEALALISRTRPDLVLMDVTISGEIDGVETAQQIPPDLHVAVIYLTAYSEESTRARAGETKPYGYLLKPIDPRELHGTIQIALERRAALQAVSASEEHLQLALHAAQMASWEWDPAKRTLHFGAGSTGIIGNAAANGYCTEVEFLADVDPDDRAVVQDMFDHLLSGQALCDAEFRYRHRTDAARWLKFQGRAFPGRESLPRRVVGVAQDITERRETEQQLRQAATVFEATQNGILILNPALKVIAANGGYSAITGFGEEEVVGSKPFILTPEAHLTGFDTLLAALAETGEWRGECRGQRKDAQLFPTMMNIAAVTDPAGDIAHYVVVLSDISALRRAEDELAHLAHHDPMTGLPNRLLALDRLDRALERGQRRKEGVAISFVDLDHFKQVNDTLGHAAGDELLRTVAKRMQSCVRSEDTVARLGGDEFMVIMDRVSSPADVAGIAAKIQAVVAEPLHIGEHELSASCTIGISLFPGDGTGREELIRAADTAMYFAKEQGRGSCSFYNREMSVKAVQYASNTRDLKRGLAQDELRLFYQPQISIENGAVVGMEALVRWQHPKSGLLGAEHVIPLSERGGLIVDVGNWVLLHACRQLKAWQGAGLPDFRVAVNVSARQMHSGRLLDTVERALAETGILPSSLEIEITESTLQNEECCLETLNGLSRLGVTLAIDDFGTGYSCLSSLKNLPIDKVKIDRAFIKNIVDDRSDVAITEAILAMAHRLNMGVIAEGVETRAQEGLLRSQGCDQAQGYLYSKPMPAEAVPGFLLSSSLSPQQEWPLEPRPNGLTFLGGSGTSVVLQPRA